MCSHLVLGVLMRKFVLVLEFISMQMQLQMQMYMYVCIYICRTYCCVGLCMYMYSNRFLFHYIYLSNFHSSFNTKHYCVYIFYLLSYFVPIRLTSHSAAVRGALRAEREDLLTVVLPQSMSKQTKESQELLDKVDDVITMPQNDDMSLDVASRICNSYILSLTDQLISFAFHESNTVVEASKEAKALDMLVTTLYLD